jgi:AcrR family transcriptional regulator
MSVTNSSSSGNAVSSSAAKTKKGRETKKQILAACKSVLTNKGYPYFSFQNIAKEAGLSLSNVQYHFATKEKLVAALMEDIGDYYKQVVDDLLKNTSADPVSRFLAVIDYNLEDISKPDTRYFFIQVWALVGALGSHRYKLLGEMYEVAIGHVSMVIEEINPLLTKGERQQRATMIAAMMEGMMLMYEDADMELEKSERNIEIEMRKQCLRIAMDP